MPTPIKCLLMFRDNSGTGWSELHYRLSSSDNPNLNVHLTNLVDVIAAARQPLLSGDCQIVGARVSYPRPGAVASLSNRMFLGGPTGVVGVSSSLSLALKWTDTTFTKNKITHMRGFWDSVEFNGEYHPEAPGAAGWQDRLNVYKAALIGAGYGWLSKDPALSSKGPVSGYISDTTGRVTFTLPGDGMPAATVGTVQPVRFSRLNRSNSPLNATLLVAVTNRNLVTTVDQVAAGPFASPGRFNYRGISFVGYSNLYSIALGRRQQGRPFFQLPGRAQARPRY